MPSAVGPPDSPLDDTTEMTVVAVPLPPGSAAGAILRPPRPITVGRRKTDRWLARLGIAALFCALLFVVYTSYQVGAFNDRLDRISNCRRP